MNFWVIISIDIPYSYEYTYFLGFPRNYFPRIIISLYILKSSIIYYIYCKFIIICGCPIVNCCSICFVFYSFSGRPLAVIFLLRVRPWSWPTTTVLPPCSVWQKLRRYSACNEMERNWYCSYEVPPVGLKQCCESLLEIIALNTNSG